MKSSFQKTVVLLLATGVLAGCQTMQTSHAVNTGNLARYNLTLVSGSVQPQANGSLAVHGGIRYRTAPAYLACGHLRIDAIGHGGDVLASTQTQYRPCRLSYRPKAKRTARFTAMLAAPAADVAEVSVSFQPGPLLTQREEIQP